MERYYRNDQRLFSFLKYLSFPLSHSKNKKEYYANLIDKIKSRLLSCGGKEILIKRVLQSIPIYILPAIVPPKSVVKDFQKKFAKFFWNNKEAGRGKHWVAWNKVCLPKQEGGLGLGLLIMCLKLWMLSYGGGLGHKVTCGMIFFEISTAKNSYLPWYNGEGDLKCGRLCTISETKQTNIYGGNLKVKPLQSDLIIEPILVHYLNNNLTFRNFTLWQILQNLLGKRVGTIKVWRMRSLII